MWALRFRGAVAPERSGGSGRERTILEVTIIAAAALAVVYVVLVAWRGVGIARIVPTPSAPAIDAADARAQLESLCALDAAECLDVACTFLLEPDGPALGTLVYFHGFTHCPEQFRAVGSVLRDRGLRVIAARQPYHGLPDRMTDALAALQPAELVDHVARTIDAAAGFDAPLHVAGLSGGGVQAAWAAATRDEVDDVLVISPAAAPGWAPLWIVRLFVRFRSLLPPTYIWWDPKTKEQRVQSEYEYPGFPLRGIIPLMHLALVLGHRWVPVTHRLSRAVLLSNPNDRAVSRSAARWMMAQTFADHTDTLAEQLVRADLGWAHDYIDPASRNSGEPEQVAEVILAALGLTEDPTAGGLLEPGDPL